MTLETPIQTKQQMRIKKILFKNLFTKYEQICYSNQYEEIPIFLKYNFRKLGL